MALRHDLLLALTRGPARHPLGRILILTYLTRAVLSYGGYNGYSSRHCLRRSMLVGSACTDRTDDTSYKLIDISSLGACHGSAAAHCVTRTQEVSTPAKKKYTTLQSIGMLLVIRTLLAARIV